jgi:outer membrane protein
MKTPKNLITSITTILFVMLLMPLNSTAQKVGFIASDIIREKFTEANQADQRLHSIVEEWKREIEDLENQIQDLEADIKKNRLIWSDEERATKSKALDAMKVQKLEYARKKFEQNGEYDATVKQIIKPIEDKIYAAVQEVASDEGYDLILDKSVNPIPYSNSKYDLTVKVLKKLGVDVEKLEAELKEKIDKDPRNQKTDSKTPPKGRTRQRTDTQQKEVERDNTKQVSPSGTNPDNVKKTEETKEIKK